MSYYVKGSSNYDTGVEANVWTALHLAGYPSSDYADTGWKDINDSGALNDPYWRLGGEGGNEEIEIGLSGQHRIKITTAGIWGWHVGSGTWFTLFGSGVYGVFDDHGLLNGLGDDDHTQYLLRSEYTNLSGDFVVVSGVVAEGLDSNTDGGRADSIYLPSQIINGGSA